LENIYFRIIEISLLRVGIFGALLVGIYGVLRWRPERNLLRIGGLVLIGYVAAVVNLHIFLQVFHMDRWSSLEFKVLGVLISVF